MVGDRLDTSRVAYRSGILLSLRRPLRPRLNVHSAYPRMTGDTALTSVRFRGRSQRTRLFGIRVDDELTSFVVIPGRSEIAGSLLVLDATPDLDEHEFPWRQTCVELIMVLI